ncbi:hypothetical protein SMA5143A_3895 [Streptomyces sp. MA5143a]|nr:hypothetical protein SMA5143A_3895 [Streptomyces sp. MA5143a]
MTAAFDRPPPGRRKGRVHLRSALRDDRIVLTLGLTVAR